MDRRKFNKGTKGNKGGRPAKVIEQKVAEKLSPLDDLAMSALKTGLENSQSWAVKLFFEYRYGRPIELKPDEDTEDDVSTEIVWLD